MPTTDPQVSKAIAAKEAEFAQLFNAKNIDRLAASYTEDARFLPPNAPIVVGRAAIREIFPVLTQVFSNLHIESGPVWVSGDLAVTHGSYTAKLTTPKGTVDDRGKFIEVWRREANGEWKIFLDTFTSDLQH